MLTELEKKLLNKTQKDFPISERPFKDIGDDLSLTETEVLEQFLGLEQKGAISRFGGVNSHKKMGASTLAALKVPEEKLDAVAVIVNQFNEVNHNYLREHEFNMWFVATAIDEAHLQRTLSKIQTETGCELLDLPMEKSFYIDLAFPL